MSKLNLVIELEYDEVQMHNGDPKGIKWFSEEVLGAEIGEDTGLMLHSNLIGDSIGPCRVLSFGEVVNLIQEQKDSLRNEGYTQGRKEAKSEFYTLGVKHGKQALRDELNQLLSGEDETESTPSIQTPSEKEGE